MDVDGLTKRRAVMDATSNLSNQEVFELARRFDPRGQRTVGVITKPDLVPAGDERNVRMLVS